MIVLSDERVIIMHTPKCAGKNLRQAFMPDDPEGQYWHWKYIPEIAGWADCAHLPLSTLRQLPEWEKIKSFTVISVVRDPYERFIGACQEHMKQHPSETLETIFNNIDEVRINHDPRYIHFMPQNRFTHIGNKRYVDFLARTDNLKNDLISIAQKANLSHEFLQAISRIKEHKKNDDFEYINVKQHNDKILKIVKRLYFRDFILYGFKPPDVHIEQNNRNKIFAHLLTTTDIMAEWSSNAVSQPAYQRFLKKNEEILERDRAIRERNIALDNLRNALHERDMANEERQTALHERDMANEERQTALHERDMANEEKNAILSSTSWRVTKFLRMMKKFITLVGGRAKTGPET